MAAGGAQLSYNLTCRCDKGSAHHIRLKRFLFMTEDIWPRISNHCWSFFPHLLRIHSTVRTVPVEVFENLKPRAGKEHRVGTSTKGHVKGRCRSTYGSLLPSADVFPQLRKFKHLLCYPVVVTRRLNVMAADQNPVSSPGFHAAIRATISGS